MPKQMTMQNPGAFPAFFKHVMSRRRALRQQFNVATQFGDIEESCIPSYLHRNPFAAGVSWLRLWTVARLYQKYAPLGPVLDFGCGSGELRPLLSTASRYHFVEANENLAARLSADSPDAVREQLDALPANRFATVFALDSLEHNDNIEPIIALLKASLRPDGVLIISGPTENTLYKLGRRIAGFAGDYHATNIYEIETVLQKQFTLLRKRRILSGAPLFLISVWQR